MLVFDLEADNLLDDITTIHCVNVKDRTTGKRMRFNDFPEIATTKPDGTLEDGLRLLQEAPLIGGQNVIDYDIPAIQKVHPWFAPTGKVRDTLVEARLVWPDLIGMDIRAINKGKRPRHFKEEGLIGRYSLDAWGKRFGKWKGDYAKIRKAEAIILGLEEDEIRHYVWGTFNADMDDYCAQDVEVTDELFDLIDKQGYPEEAMDLERRVAEIIGLQMRQGVEFDLERAEKLHVELVSEAAELEDLLRTAFPPWFEPVRKYGQPEIANPKRGMTRKLDTDGVTVPTRYDQGHEYCKVKLVSFEPGSRDMIANRLKTLFGWNPQEFTEGGKPKVDETTLNGLDYPEAELLKKYLIIAKRLGTLANGKKALLRKVKKDGRIYPKVKSNGARTGRMTHYDPNVNLPKVKKGKDKAPIKGLAGGYGYEFRQLFKAAKGKLLVGADAEGLELRMLAHYMARYDGGAFARAVVEGKSSEGTDAHTINQKLIGLNSRDNTKTFVYAYLYGSGNHNLGTIVYEDFTDDQRTTFNAKYPPGDARDGAFRQLGGAGRRKLEEGLPALAQLQDAVQTVKVKAQTPDGRPATRKKMRKFLRSLDGRQLQSVSKHSALNTLLQGGGAIVMKKALVLAYDALIERGWKHGREFAFVLNVHDEFQLEVDTDIPQEVGEIATEAIKKAGEYYALRVPLAGSSDHGESWAETH